jgi:hypothetical protein
VSRQAVQRMDICRQHARVLTCLGKDEKGRRVLKTGEPAGPEPRTLADSRSAGSLRRAIRTIPPALQARPQAKYCGAADEAPPVEWMEC